MNQLGDNFRGTQFGSSYEEVAKLNGIEQILGTTSLISQDTFLGVDWLISYYFDEGGGLEVGKYTMSKEFPSYDEGISFMRLLREKFVSYEKLNEEHIVENDFDIGYVAWKRNKLSMSFSFIPIANTLEKSIVYSLSIEYEI